MAGSDKGQGVWRAAASWSKNSKRYDPLLCHGFEGVYRLGSLGCHTHRAVRASTDEQRTGDVPKVANVSERQEGALPLESQLRIDKSLPSPSWHGHPSFADQLSA